jgi:hypothetical protein
VLLEKKKEEIFLANENAAFLKQNNFFPLFEHVDFFLRPPFVCTNTFDIFFGTKNAITPLKYERNHRNFFVCIEGSVTIKLGVPNKIMYDLLHENPEYQNPWTMDENTNKNSTTLKKKKKTKNVFHANTINIILKQGEILFMPPYWWYSILFTEDISFVFKFNYRTYMNTLAILPELITKNYFTKYVF